MKIGFVSECYYPWPGGTSERLYHLARELRGRGHDVRIITGRVDTKLSRFQSRLPLVSVGRCHVGPAPDESDVIRLGRSMALPLRGAVALRTVGTGLGARLRRTLRREAFDLLHVHDPLAPSLPRLAAAVATCPVVGTYLPGSLDRAQGRRSRVVQSLAAHVAVSARARDAFAAMFADLDCRVVTNGVDLQQFRPNGSSLAGRFGAHKKNILFVGQLARRKGFDVLLQAFRELSDRRGDVRLIAVGDGPQARALGKAGLRDVHFLGHRRGKPLAQCYEIADVFVAPSVDAETFGTTLLEAMAARKPIVATDVDGYRDVVADEREALLVPSGSASALGTAIERVLDDETLARRLTVLGSRRVRSFTWARVVDGLEAIYDEVAGTERLEPALAVGEH